MPARQAWGACLRHHVALGRWSMMVTILHIIVLELLTLTKAFGASESLLRSWVVQVASDSTTAVSYMDTQGGTQ